MTIDNPTCLMVLDTLLCKCQYHVTTTSRATTALTLLRENRNKFDLVISDVDMPDMDGFKLLALLELEMDLPVIMLSAYDDTNLVRKGISHGACNYLLKPVRIEELRNIWQQVLRRKILDSKERRISDQVPSEAGEDFTGTGDSDHHGRLCRKRKDQNDSEDEKQDDNGQHFEDPSSQKKPRVVWSPELHQKFVAAVHQLGIKKAFRKKILEMMNVEKLTRENVASHQQKYKLYLKRISCVASQQASRVSAIRSSNFAVIHNGSLPGAANVQSMAASMQSVSAAYKLLLPGAVLGRLNAPDGFGMHGLSSSRMIQFGHALTINPINGIPNAYSDIVSGNPSINTRHGMPMPLLISFSTEGDVLLEMVKSPAQILNQGFTVVPVAS